MSDTERLYRERIRQAGDLIDELTRLTTWLQEHGVGTDVAIRSTVTEHETRIAALEAQQ